MGNMGYNSYNMNNMICWISYAAVPCDFETWGKTTVFKILGQVPQYEFLENRCCWSTSFVTDWWNRLRTA